MSDISLKKTPLYDFHLDKGGKMVSFAGYHLPVSYPLGIVKEHLHTRKQASLFDVSHMGQLHIKGKGTASALEKLMPANLSTLGSGQAVYSFLVNDQGGIIDDLIISRESDDGFFVVVNASRKTIDESWIEKHLPSSVTMIRMTEHALMALQGPKSAEILGAFSPSAVKLSFMQSCNDSIEGIACHIARSGYTGEDGFEISCPADQAIALAKILTRREEVALAGLGARDTLRIEAGLCLYGDDIDETTSPVEAGLSWAIAKSRRENGTFKGADIILPQIKNKTASKFFRGFLPEGRIPVRKGAEIFSPQGEVIGHITSGGFSPMIEVPVAMGYINKDFAVVDSEVILQVRGKNISAKITKLPFVSHNYVRS